MLRLLWWLWPKRTKSISTRTREAALRQGETALQAILKLPNLPSRSRLILNQALQEIQVLCTPALTKEDRHKMLEIWKDLGPGPSRLTERPNP